MSFDGFYSLYEEYYESIAGSTQLKNWGMGVISCQPVLKVSPLLSDLCFDKTSKHLMEKANHFFHFHQACIGVNSSYAENSKLRQRNCLFDCSQVIY